MKNLKKSILALSILISGEHLEASDNDHLQDLEVIRHSQWAHDNFDINVNDPEKSPKIIRDEIEYALHNFDFNARPGEFSQKFFEFMKDVDEFKYCLI